MFPIQVAGESIKGAAFSPCSGVISLRQGRYVLHSSIALHVRPSRQLADAR